MSIVYFKLYKRIIENYSNGYTEEHLAEIIDDAHTKGRLTDGEYSELSELIDKRFANN